MRYGAPVGCLRSKYCPALIEIVEQGESVRIVIAKPVPSGLRLCTFHFEVSMGSKIPHAYLSEKLVWICARIGPHPETLFEGLLVTHVEFVANLSAYAHITYAMREF